MNSFWSENEILSAEFSLKRRRAKVLKFRKSTPQISLKVLFCLAFQNWKHFGSARSALNPQTVRVTPTGRPHTDATNPLPLLRAKENIHEHSRTHIFTVCFWFLYTSRRSVIFCQFWKRNFLKRSDADQMDFKIGCC